jgi:hypothetical protein
MNHRDAQPKAVLTARYKRWRGVMVELVYQNFHNQGSRYDDIGLWGVMRDMGHDLGVNQARALLIELKESGYLRFKAVKNDYTNETEISEIEITPDGCKVAERLKPDDSILILG